MIEWLLQTSDAHAGLAEGVPPAGLLSAAERERWEALRAPKRRREWLLGRWTAKRLVRAALGGDAPLEAFVVATAADGAPEAAGLSLSISHSHDRALCALVREPGLTVGCDVERIETRAPGFARDYFTPAELALVAGAPEQQRDALVSAVWSAKEAALKALRLGLSVDTRAVTCLPRMRETLTPRPHLPPQRERGRRASDGGEGLPWLPIDITCHPTLLGRDAPALRGWWRAEGGFVLTIALAGGAAGAPGAAFGPTHCGVTHAGRALEGTGQGR